MKFHELHFSNIQIFLHIRTFKMGQNNKKTGRPLGLFSELQFSHNLQTSYETTLRYRYVYPNYTSSTIQTNRMHHLHSTLSTDEELTN
jgi:hypothetical protein